MFRIVFMAAKIRKNPQPKPALKFPFFLLLVTAFSVYIIISIEIIIGTVFALRSDYRVILLKL